MLRKVTVFAILIALLVAAFPTFGVLAKGPAAEKLEGKWDELTTAFRTQSVNHNQIHKDVEHWLKNNKDASASDKAKVNVHLNACNSAFAAAERLVANHPGFDSKGKVVDLVSAKQSVKSLTYYFEWHKGTIRSLREHIK
jgi:hypothetical protein